ncbi:MFS transporter [Streptomyces sp. SLBN-8D4]|jgi:predicted MFS family arabinose efflux permease|uniref:MFS transporter n=1 Tax=Streptomyces sp. SLBN-8D4 TaxID=3377728 RepID=UPI003C7BDB13
MSVASSIRASTTRAVGGLPPVFWWLWASTLINRLGTFVAPFLTLYLTTSQGRTVTFAGLTAAVVGVGGMTGSLVGGVATDRLGGRTVLLASHASAAASTVLLGLSTSDVLLVTSGFLVGLFSGASRPATSALMHDLLDHRDRVRAFSLNYWAMNLGFAASVLFAGFAAEAGYQLLFIADACATLACALVLLYKVPAPAIKKSVATGPPDHAFGSLRTNTPFLLCVVLFTVLSTVLQQMTVTLPVAMSASGLTPATCGALIALNGVLICVLQVPAGQYLCRRSPFTMLAMAAVLIGAGFGFTALASSVLWFAVTVCIWTLGEIISGPVSMEVTARFAGQGKQGRYQGMAAFAWTVGGTIASAAGGFAYGHYGSSALWIACAGACLMSAIGFMLLHQIQPRLAKLT